MKYLSAFFITLFISFNVHADYYDYVEKPVSLGFGIYNSTIAFDSPGFEDDELSGIGFSLGYSISDQFALRMTYFSLEHDDFSDIDSTGFDLTAYLSSGLASYGFKAYVGGGFFNDKWKLGGFSETFSGLQFNGGIGYNWEAVSVDFILGIRDASDYEDFANDAFGTNASAGAITTLLMLSARF